MIAAVTIVSSGHQPHQLEALRLFRGPFDRRSGVFNPSPPSPLPIHRSTPIEENGVATVVSYTCDNEFFKAKSETFPLMRFFLELTQHIPPKGCQYIRRYGLYASRTKGKWQHQPYDAEAMYAVSDKESRSSWARLIAQVYEVDPLTCSRCGSPMRILAVITEPEEVRKILRHLVKTGRSPPGLDPTSLK